MVFRCALSLASFATLAACASSPAPRDVTSPIDASNEAPAPFDARDTLEADLGTPHDAPTDLSRTDAADAPSDIPLEASGPVPIFDDEFDGPANAPPDPTKWNIEVGDYGRFNQELECYTGQANDSYLDGAGHLLIVARYEPGTVCEMRTLDYTSARLDTKGLFSSLHGRMEMRARLPTARGMWPAFWALGNNIDTVSWPTCGEIDTVEVIGTTPDIAYGTVHGPTSAGAEWSIGGTSDAGVDLYNDFHVYGVVWTAGTIAFQLDGVTYETVHQSAAPSGAQWVFDDHPFFLLLNLAVGGNWPGAPDATTTFPQTMIVDYVRVYP